MSLAIDAAVSQAARDILDHGFAIVKLPEADRQALHNAIGAANDFFARDLDFKNAHGSADHNYGYRPFGVEYSVSPDRPDMNEVFTVWASRLDLIPHAHDIPELTGAFLAWRDSIAPLVQAILDEVAKGFGAPAAPEFERASYMQINSYLETPAERELLQDKHEDGHMVTVLHATAPGLERHAGDEVHPFTPAEDELLVMPGSVLTALSGGKIEPLFHQVRNLGLNDRQSIMYFVNPVVDEPLYSWVDAGEQTDLRDYVQHAPAMFGLPPVEAL